MKQLFRAVVLLLLVGGWGLATAAVHVVRTPSNIAVVPKDRLGYRDTFVDTRKWTIAEDTAHPAVVNRLVELGRADLLRHTLPANTADADAVLAAIGASRPVPGVPTAAGAEAAVEHAGVKVRQAAADAAKRM